MALDDFDSTPPVSGQSAPEDEDLFNFPASDLGADVDSHAAPLPAPVLAEAPARTPEPPARVARPPLASSVGTRETHVASAPVSERASAAVVESRTGDRADTSNIRNIEDQIERAPLPSATPAARKPVLTSVEAPEESPLAAQAPAPPVRASRPLALASPARTTWLVIGGVVVLNVAAFALVWHSNRSFRAGLEGLRDDLAVTLHDVRRSASDASSSVQAAQSTHSDPSETPEPRHASSTPLAPFEETTLLLARQEIAAGEQVQARKRLYRLLAVADRIDADLRKQVEAQASYLIGDSYRHQADAQREAQR